MDRAVFEDPQDFKVGFAGGPVMGREAAALISGEAAGLNLGPYRLGRFG